MKNILFTGCGTAIVTPFKNGKIDVKAFEKLIKFQIDNGVDAIIVCGTTGEAPTLTDTEHIELIKLAVRFAKNNIQIIAGTGSNCTEHAVYMSKQAYKYGANGILSVTPYYNKCSDEGLVEHYRKVADATPLPIIVYNVPSRTGYNITPETLKKLVEIENICGIKDAASNIIQTAEYMSLCPDIKLYSGNDNQIVPIMSLGGCGVISVISNILPAETKKITDLYINGHIEESKKLQIKLLPIINSLFIKPNPIPVKFAMELMGLCSSELRLPLSPLDRKSKDAIIFEMRKINLI